MASRVAKRAPAPAKGKGGRKPWEKDDDGERLDAEPHSRKRQAPSKSEQDKRKFDTKVHQYKRQAGQVVREHKRRHPLPPPEPKQKKAPQYQKTRRPPSPEQEEQEEDQEEYEQHEEEEGNEEEEEEINSIDEILDVANFHRLDEEGDGGPPPKKTTMAEFMNMDPLSQQRQLVQDRVGRDAERLALLQKDAAFQGSAALYNTVGERFWEEKDEPEEEGEEEGIPLDEEDDEEQEPEEPQYDNDRGRGLNRLSTETFIQLAQDKLAAEPQNNALRNVIDHAQRGRYKPGRDDGWGPSCIIPHLHQAGQFDLAKDVQSNLFDFSK